MAGGGELHIPDAEARVAEERARGGHRRPRVLGGGPRR